MKSYLVRRLPESLPATERWAHAGRLADFTFPWETTTPPRTEFRALWDDGFLHFRFDCEDAAVLLGKGETLKERVLDSDRVEIFLAPSLELTPYYAFEMSPAGEALVYSARFYREYDWDWTCPGLCLRAGLVPGGYYVEGSLPLETLRSLGVLEAGSRRLLAGVYRAEFSPLEGGGIHRGWMPWANPETEKPDFHVPASFGVFELVD